MYIKTPVLFFILIILVLLSCEKDKGTITEPYRSDSTHVEKPNIYIYPTQKIELDIYLSFPKGGSVVQSIPQYNNGWSVTVDTSGLINNKYHYLFYECRVPNYFQKEKGWIIEQENLEDFFRENLNLSGFVDNEINDFVEYWIPRLDYSSEYIIYPQYINNISSLVELIFSKTPDSLLRLFYLIEENTNQVSQIEKPLIPEFLRHGFTVAEWGVIIY